MSLPSLMLVWPAAKQEVTGGFLHQAGKDVMILFCVDCVGMQFVWNVKAYVYIIWWYIYVGTVIYVLWWR